MTSNSFRANWSPAGTGVLSYLVKYKVAIGEEEFIVSVPAPVTTTVLTNLLPQTTYTVSVIAEYEDGDGPSLDGEETTLEGIVCCCPVFILETHDIAFIAGGGWDFQICLTLTSKLSWYLMTWDLHNVKVIAVPRSLHIRNPVQ